jgi:hypothetical protein
VSYLLQARVFIVSADSGRIGNATGMYYRKGARRANEKNHETILFHVAIDIFHHGCAIKFAEFSQEVRERFKSKKSPVIADSVFCGSGVHVVQRLAGYGSGPV